MYRKVKWWIIQWMARRLPPCNVITHKLSEAEDNRLTLRERLVIRTHLLVCVWCTRFSRQLEVISNAAQTVAREPDRLNDALPKLSQATFDRIKQRLQDQSPPDRS